MDRCESVDNDAYASVLKEDTEVEGLDVRSNCDGEFMYCNV